MEGRMLNFDVLALHYNVTGAKDINGNKVEWLKVHQLHFDSCKPDSFFVSYDYVSSEMYIKKGNKTVETFGAVPPLPLQSSVTEAKKKTCYGCAMN
jgi:hypothetical protein